MAAYFIPIADLDKKIYSADGPIKIGDPTPPNLIAAVNAARALGRQVVSYNPQENPKGYLTKKQTLAWLALRYRGFQAVASGSIVQY